MLDNQTWIATFHVDCYVKNGSKSYGASNKYDLLNQTPGKNEESNFSYRKVYKEPTVHYKNVLGIVTKFDKNEFKYEYIGKYCCCSTRGKLSK